MAGLTGTREGRKGICKIWLCDSDEEVLTDQQDWSADSSTRHGDYRFPGNKPLPFCHHGLLRMNSRSLPINSRSLDLPDLSTTTVPSICEFTTSSLQPQPLLLKARMFVVHLYFSVFNIVWSNSTENLFWDFFLESNPLLRRQQKCLWIHENCFHMNRNVKRRRRTRKIENITKPPIATRLIELTGNMLI